MAFRIFSRLRAPWRRLPSLPRLPSPLRSPRIIGSILTLQLASLIFYIHRNIFIIEKAGGPSMIPTLEVFGQYVFVDKTSHSGRNISVGDLVLFWIPNNSGQLGIKRVVGMPGDYVMLGTPGEKGDEKMIQVPKGHCYVVGDNLPVSRDSRHWGPLPLALVRGKAMATVFPLDERRWLSNSLRMAET